MKYIKQVNENFHIYELSEEEQKVFNGKFAVSQGHFSDWAIKNMGEIELLKGLKPHLYEEFFQTELEAFYHIKLVEMQKELERIEYSLKDLQVSKIEWLA